MNAMLPRLGALALGTMLLTAAYNRTNSASVMTEAANRFLASLTAGAEGQGDVQVRRRRAHELVLRPDRAEGTAAARDDAVPEAPGAARCSAPGLSQSGYMKAVTIMSLEDVLQDHGKGRRASGAIPRNITSRSSARPAITRPGATAWRATTSARTSPS